MKRAVVFGGAGQLGQELLREFSSRGYEVHALDRAAGDITSSDRVEQVLVEFAPQLVLNAAAYNKVDLAEKEVLTAYQVNALAVRNLAVACRKQGARLVHFSTDYVFDGLGSRPYIETDETHPLSAYAVSKLSGELYARAYLERPLIVRPCGVFGPAGAQTAGGNFVETMLRLAAKGGPVRVVSDFVASPTFAPALAARTADLVERDADGVFHIGGGAPISWFDWARKIFAAAGLSPQLTPVTHDEFPTPARRPQYSALSNAKAEALGIAPMPSMDEAIRTYFERRPRPATAGS